MSIVKWINSCYYLTFIIFAYKVWDTITSSPHLKLLLPCELASILLSVLRSLLFPPKFCVVGIRSQWYNHLVTNDNEWLRYSYPSPKLCKASDFSFLSSECLLAHLHHHLFFLSVILLVIHF